MTTNPPNTLREEVKEILNSHCKDAHPTIEECQQIDNILSLIKQVGDKIIEPEEVLNISENPNRFMANPRTIWDNELKESQRHTLDDIISGKEKI